MREKCNFCNGSGHQRSTRPGALEGLEDLADIIGTTTNFRKRPEPICFKCIGVGFVEKPELRFECPICHGEGGFPKYRYKEICDDCLGNGYIEGRPNFIDRELSKKDEPILNCYLIFIDIVKYSKRPTHLQDQIIKKLNRIIDSTIKELTRENRVKFSKNSIDLYKDSILLPIGDGVVVVFPFDIIRNIHLIFATKVLVNLERELDYHPCYSFEHSGFCKKHPHFKIRIGIGKSDCIIYRDIIRKYNVAGDEVNFTSRVMGKAKPNNIVFTVNAYNDFISFGGGSKSNFIARKGVIIKHGDKIDIYRYRPNPTTK